MQYNLNIILKLCHKIKLSTTSRAKTISPALRALRSVAEILSDASRAGFLVLAAFAAVATSLMSRSIRAARVCFLGIINILEPSTRDSSI
jgi:hypothetical protein